MMMKLALLPICRGFAHGVLGGLIAVIMSVPPLAYSATFLVNSETDSIDTVPGDGVCADADGLCSLRAAVLESNALDGADTIDLPPGHFRISIPGVDEDLGFAGDIDIEDIVSIRGFGSESTIIDGNALDRVFEIQDFRENFSVAEIRISDVTITGGFTDSRGAGLRDSGGDATIEISNCRFEDNTALGYGGAAVWSPGVPTTIRNSTISSNTGLYAVYAEHGSILDSIIDGNSGCGAELGEDSDVAGSQITNNACGIVSAGVQVSGSVVANNAGNAFTIRPTDNTGFLFISNSYLFGNGGAGISSHESVIEIENSTLVDNRTGIDLDNSCRIRISNSTFGLSNLDDHPSIANGIAGNFSTTVCSGGDMIIADSTILSPVNITSTDSYHAAELLRVQNSIVTEDIVASCEHDPACNGLDLLFENVICSSSGACATIHAGTTAPLEATIAPLDDNGGSTPTHALPFGSIAIDATAGLCPGVDQRGAARPRGAACDIGAFEFGCGDGSVDVGEECDDGNLEFGDCCAPDCTFESTGAPCSDGSMCNGQESCDGAGSCEPSDPMCKASARGAFRLINRDDDSRDTIRWKWLTGQVTTLAELGSPTGTTEFALCIIDSIEGEEIVARELLFDRGEAWRSRATGFRYSTRTGIPDGITRARIKAGIEGRSKITLKGKGAQTRLPESLSPFQYFSVSPTLMLRLVNSEGTCWESRFGIDRTTVNRGDKFVSSYR